ncbi:biotin--[acetyl-CoA-carboxylase] ligase [Rubellicoccus peritrichatus]|uniref:Bifunctional ligase/repressor BirA n=1 Tax=Rubellicoccus peritrichatus TaxID=3080537 RepID=A0AAQ3L8T7_9BACT|nr:biotin--[acetyl-CoA-carboxylase] ligase [Puniceicoccus sp. CR14]WOO41211.1 biotin--[acetyl-CoA-carboxylase] ligase [Puniceicoccus sp. CR14]
MSEDINIAIVAALIDAQPGYLSGSSLADSLELSRVSIKAHMDQLKNEGLRIEAIRNRGYRLISLPESLHPSVLEAMLRHERVTADFRFYKSIDSTNTEAERALADGCPTPLVIAAGHQTKGRGRLGREWFSEDPGNIYMSFVFRPHLAPSRMQRFTLWMGLELCAELHDQFDAPLMLKWPNDLVANGKKVAGILTEARIDSDQTRDLVLGCGININSNMDNWPEEIRQRATTLSQLKGTALDINQLGAALIRRGLNAYDAFVDGSYEKDFDSRWHRFNALEGQTVTITDHHGDHIGTIEGIDEAGALLMRDKSGITKTYQAGDVTLSGGLKPWVA